MSTLNVTIAQITTLKDASGNNSTTPADLVKGRAKYWCVFQGTGTAAVLDSFNNAGFSDTSTGKYSLTIDTDFDSINYVSLGTVSNSSRGNLSIEDVTAGSLTVSLRETDSGDFTDYTIVSVAAFGDQ